jgi:hypothetical protein
MNEVIAALERGRTRLRRRAWTAAVGVGALLAIGGAWRIAQANRVACDIPKDRIAAVWDPNDVEDARRRSSNPQRYWTCACPASTTASTRSAPLPTLSRPLTTPSSRELSRLPWT